MRLLLLTLPYWESLPGACKPSAAYSDASCTGFPNDRERRSDHVERELRKMLNDLADPSKMAGEWNMRKAILWMVLLGLHFASFEQIGCDRDHLHLLC